LGGFSIYGPGQLVRGGSSGVLSILAQRARSGLPLDIDSPALRDFVYVQDAATAVRLALTVPRAVGNVYNVGCGVATPLLDLAALARAATGSQSPIRPPPPGEPTGYVADLTRARADLGFTPTISLEEGLRRYVAWLSDCANFTEDATDPATAGGEAHASLAPRPRAVSRPRRRREGRRGAYRRRAHAQLRAAGRLRRGRGGADSRPGRRVLRPRGPATGQLRAAGAPGGARRGSGSGGAGDPRHRAAV